MVGLLSLLLGRRTWALVMKGSFLGRLHNAHLTISDGVGGQSESWRAFARTESAF